MDRSSEGSVSSTADSHAYPAKVGVFSHVPNQTRSNSPASPRRAMAAAAHAAARTRGRSSARATRCAARSASTTASGGADRGPAESNARVPSSASRVHADADDAADDDDDDAIAPRSATAARRRARASHPRHASRTDPTGREPPRARTGLLSRRPRRPRRRLADATPREGRLARRAEEPATTSATSRDATNVGVWSQIIARIASTRTPGDSSSDVATVRVAARVSPSRPRRRASRRRDAMRPTPPPRHAVARHAAPTTSRASMTRTSTMVSTYAASAGKSSFRPCGRRPRAPSTRRARRRARVPRRVRRRRAQNRSQRGARRRRRHRRNAYASLFLFRRGFGRGRGRGRGRRSFGSFGSGLVLAIGDEPVEKRRTPTRIDRRPRRVASRESSRTRAPPPRTPRDRRPSRSPPLSRRL